MHLFVDTLSRRANRHHFSGYLPGCRGYFSGVAHQLYFTLGFTLYHFVIDLLLRNANKKQVIRSPGSR
jgi:hypothetical protein